MFRPLDPLELLRRRDKHYLGAGDGFLFAPTRPRWLDRPGFWDGGRVFLYPVEPLFTVSFVAADGRERALRQMHRVWTPAELVVSYSAGGLELEERRVVLPGGRFLSEWRVTNGLTEPAELTVVAWTAQEGRLVTARDALSAGGRGITFCRTASAESGEIGLRATLSFDLETAEGWAVYETEEEPGHPIEPEWARTPFRDRWQHPVLPQERRLAPLFSPDERRLVYAGLSRRVRLGAGEADAFTVAMQVLPLEPTLQPLAAKTVPAPGRASAHSRTAWQQYFAAAPTLGGSDPYLERCFPYRWYGLRLAGLDPAGQLGSPTIAADVAARHCAIAESVWGQVRELRWLADPARARGILRSFLARQDEAGRLPDRLLLDRTAPRGVQLADWGGSLLAVDEVHPDDDFLAACYVPLCRYAACVDRERDAEGSGLFEAAASGDGGRRKGVALTVYQYRLRRALAVAAGRIGRSDEAGAHAAAADRIAESVRGRLWDRDTEMFLDLDPGSGRPAPTKLVTSFYPYMTDLAGAEHLAGLERHLFNRAEFWRPVPVPSLAACEPGYSPDGEMDGVRRNRPVNGRVWPAANCHIAEALARVALALDPRYRERAGEFLQRFVRMMFSDGDPTRPNAYEHYSPETGRPSAWRGLDDVQQGWINDLLIRYVAGVRPDGAGLVVDPLPCGVDRLDLERLPYRGRRIGVAIAGGDVKVTVDGTVAAEGPFGGALVVELEGREGGKTES